MIPVPYITCGKDMCQRVMEKKIYLAFEKKRNKNCRK